MRRGLVVGAVVAAAIAIAVAAALSRSVSTGSDAVATIGGERVTRNQLDLMVEHFHEEADREGRPFPKDGTAAFRVVERRALALLLYRLRLEVAAARIGVRVSATAVQQQVAQATSGEQEGATIRAKAEAAFTRGTVRAQLLTQRVFARVTAGVGVTRSDVRAYYRTHRAIYGRTPFRRLAAPIRQQLLATRRNAAMGRWLARAQRIRAEIRDDDLKG
jgi:SurA N-terminal domain